MLLSIATVNTVGYKLMLLLHLLAVIVAFAPAFVNPFLSARYRKEAGGMPVDLAAKLAKGSQTVHGPALVLVGLFGFGMIGMSEKAIKFSDSWISAALLVWFIMLGVVWGLLIPAEKKVGQGDAEAEKLVPMFGGITHLLLLIMLVIMVFQPGR